MLGNDILLTQALLFPPVLIQHPVRALVRPSFQFSKPLLGSIPYSYLVTLRILLDKKEGEKHLEHPWRKPRMCWIWAPATPKPGMEAYTCDLSIWEAEGEGADVL